MMAFPCKVISLTQAGLTKKAEQENVMQQFIARYEDQIQGVVSGFDRLIFRGSLRRLNYGHWDRGLGAMIAVGMEQYLWQNRILFKHYADHVKRVSERVKKACLRPWEEQKSPIVFLRGSQADKEQLARRIAAERNIREGLVCAFSTLESSPTFEHRGTHIIRRTRPCHVLYQYQFHPVLGWMHARIQTWFPFNVQIALNGREWLARQMDREGMRYRQQGNCFVSIEDYTRAQKLLEEQLKTNWAALLDGFARQLNPLHESLFESYETRYYWTVFQSEWATDVVFREAAFLQRLMPLLTRHGLLSFGSADVLRYFGRKVNRSGAIPAHFGGKLETDLKLRAEGERVKYRFNGNSAKFYDKAYSSMGSVLRAAETTINSVEDFRVYRPKEGGPEDDLAWRDMRKGIADLHRRAEISHKTNARLMDALASVDDSRSVEELTADIQKRATSGGRKVRGLRPWGDDKTLLRAVNHGEFTISGFRNRNLQELLYDTEPGSPVERRRRSSAISRKLRMLRAHGIVRKIQRTHRYQLTDAGRTILLAVLTVARTSLHQLNQLPKAA
jgi:hypothetical protein